MRLLESVSRLRVSQASRGVVVEPVGQVLKRTLYSASLDQRLKEGYLADLSVNKVNCLEPVNPWDL
jgi:hypothetical protein